MKETKEILDNILRMKKSEYEILETSSASISKKQQQKQDERANVLPGRASALLSKEDTDDDIENYQPTQEMDFEVEEVKDCLEKKKKRRNYIEFRPDYEKS